MKSARFDLTLAEDEVMEVNDGRVSIAIPKEIVKDYLQLPKRSRNKKVRDFIIALVKSNMTKT